MSTEVAPLPAEVASASGRLLLRQWRVDEAEQLAAAITVSAEHLRPWMAWVADEPLSIERRRERIGGWAEAQRAGTDTALAIWLLDGDRPVAAGGCGLHRRAAGRPDILEIGYWIHVEHTRRGIATEVARTLTTAGFAVATTTEIVIHHDPANTASAAVAAAAGYLRADDEPCIVGDDEPSATWRLGRDDWERQVAEAAATDETVAPSTASNSSSV